MWRALVVLIIGVAAANVSPIAAQQNNAELREVANFAKIPDVKERSRALFSEAARVITGPRCMNCHPANDIPTQGNDMHPHTPPVTRGAAGLGVPGNTCQTCHTQANYTLLERTSYQSIPGHPRWSIAPIEMAWQGKSVSEICQQIKDLKRNGNRDLDRLYEHLANDDLVAWGWNPGAGRDPAPGSQQRLGELIRAWIDSGAECP